MSNAIPAKLLKLRFVAEVPRNEFIDLPQRIEPEQTQSRLWFLRQLRNANRPPVGHKTVVSMRKTFNAAVWLRFLQTPQAPVSLWLKYRDASGEYAVMVDEMQLESDAAMLSGCVTIQTRGALSYLQAHISGLRASDVFSVEELYVQRQSPDLNNETQSHSA